MEWLQNSSFSAPNPQGEQGSSTSSLPLFPVAPLNPLEVQISRPTELPISVSSFPSFGSFQPSQAAPQPVRPSAPSGSTDRFSKFVLDESDSEDSKNEEEEEEGELIEIQNSPQQQDVFAPLNSNMRQDFEHEQELEPHEFDEWDVPGEIGLYGKPQEGGKIYTYVHGSDSDRENGEKRLSPLDTSDKPRREDREKEKEKEKRKKDKKKKKEKERKKEKEKKREKKKKDSKKSSSKSKKKKEDSEGEDLPGYSSLELSPSSSHTSSRSTTPTNITSSSSSEDSEYDRKKEKRRLKKEFKKKLKKEKKKMEKRIAEALGKTKSDAGSGGGALVVGGGEQEQPSEPLFFIDTKGDKDNEFYGSTYRGDVPRYRQPRSKDSKSGKGGPDRYYDGKKKADNEGEKFMSGGAADLLMPIEEKPLAASVAGKPQPLGSKQQKERRGEDKSEEEEAPEESLLRRTREFNKRLRDNPKDPEAWIQYSAFQDECGGLSVGARGGDFIAGGGGLGAMATAEKKAAILERGLEANPHSIRIWLTYLSACKMFLEADKMEILWHRALKINPSDVRLWLSYFDFVQSHFASFSVRRMRKAHTLALKALLECKRNPRKMVQPLFSQGGTASDEELGYQIELSMIRVLQRACAFERLCGYGERAHALQTAMVELNCFCPPFVLTWEEQIEKFEKFWDSEAPRIGEEGASGWRSWDPSVPHEPIVPEGEELDQEQEDILARIYDNHDLIDLIEDSEVFVEWGKLERERDRDESFVPLKPIRDWKAVESCPDRVVMFDDLRDYLFPVTHPSLQRRLVHCLLQSLGVAVLNREQAVTDADVLDDLVNRDDSAHLFSAMVPPDAPEDTTSSRFDWSPQAILDQERADCARRVMLQCVSVDQALVQRLVEFEATQAQDTSVARSAAKEALRTRREDLNLWSTYAALEAASGNLAEARKVFDLALMMPRTTSHQPTSTAGGGVGPKSTPTARGEESQPPLLSVSDPLRYAHLCLSYARLELRTNNVANASYILSYASDLSGDFVPLYATKKKKKEQAGVEPSPSTTPQLPALTATRLLRVKKAYKDFLDLWVKDSPQEPWSPLSSSSSSIHQPSPHQISSYISCYALFELLTSAGNLDSAVSVFEQALGNKEKWGRAPNAAVAFEPLLEIGGGGGGGDGEESLGTALEEQLLWIEYIHMLMHPGPSIIVPPTTLRMVVQGALTRFPLHPLFLALFVETEQHSLITGKLRIKLDAVCKRFGSPIPFLFSIFADSSRPNSTPRVRQVFETAMSLPGCRRSALLWRSYLRFETSLVDNGAIQAGSKDDRTKRVLFRAIDACPHAKQVFLDALCELGARNLISLQELRDILDLMSEKTVHMRTPLSDLIDFSSPEEEQGENEDDEEDNGEEGEVRT